MYKEQQIYQEFQKLEKYNLAFFTKPRHYSLEYYHQLASIPESDLVTIVFPNNAELEIVAGILESSELKHHYCYLSGTLFPTQAKQVISMLSGGQKKIFLISADNFLYWFGPFLQEGKEHNFDSSLYDNLSVAWERMFHIVLQEFSNACKGNVSYRAKYHELAKLISKANRSIMLFSSEGSELMQRFYTDLYPIIKTHEASITYPWIRFNILYEFSRQKQLQALIKVLEEKEEPTLIYLQPSSGLNLSDLILELNKLVPELDIHSYDQSFPPEHQAESLEYYLKDNGPILIITADPYQLPLGREARRIIFFSAPSSIESIYKQSALQSDSLKELHLITCEDDFTQFDTEAQRRLRIDQREGLMANYAKQKSNLLDLISQTKGCHWQNIEQIMLGKIISESCGLCNLCRQENKKSLWHKVSMSMLKHKVK